MKSSSDAFEDAEIAREGDRNDLAELIPLGFTNSDPYSNVFEVADAILAAGFSRQSPASTTAADAWDEGYKRGFYDRETMHGEVRSHVEGKSTNPYRVAAPEGDGGNE